MNINERIQLLSEDIDTILSNHLSHHLDIVQVLLEEDLPIMIDYIQQVESFINIAEVPNNKSESTTSFMSGYMSALNDLKTSLNEITND